MENNEQILSTDTSFEALIGRYLNLRNGEDRDFGPANGHLDEDSLAAFTEGRLAIREARPILRHLVDCSFCRQVTAELVRLDMAFAEEPVPAKIESSEQSAVSSVITRIYSRITGSGKFDGFSTGDEVFAHHKTDEPEKEDSAEDTDDKN
ncbi:MAG: hypothetical protein WBD22_10090 [Pyrinomonadaceae bacterium]